MGAIVLDDCHLAQDSSSSIYTFLRTAKSNFLLGTSATPFPDGAKSAIAMFRLFNPKVATQKLKSLLANARSMVHNIRPFLLPWVYRESGFNVGDTYMQKLDIQKVNLENDLQGDLTALTADVSPSRAIFLAACRSINQALYLSARKLDGTPQTSFDPLPLALQFQLTENALTRWITQVLAKIVLQDGRLKAMR
ncbi:hypothetical protein BDZ91DRAFT_364203 [Kalaharituber pfeilii]|nr:hypothetical protein BDZ91DRAFT_364203 [Kalaharituber pfeilii]